PDVGQPAALPARHPAPGRPHPGGAAGGHPARRDPGRPRGAAGRPHPDAGRLGAPVRRLAAGAGRAHPQPAAAAGRLHRLHRLRLPVPGPVRAGQPARPLRRARPGAAAPHRVRPRLSAHSTGGGTSVRDRGRRWPRRSITETTAVTRITAGVAAERAGIVAGEAWLVRAVKGAPVMAASAIAVPMRWAVWSTPPALPEYSSGTSASVIAWFGVMTRAWA